MCFFSFAIMERYHQGDLDNNQIYSETSPKIDFGLLLEFGLHQPIYAQFMKNLDQIVFHEHLKNQLLRLLPQYLRVSHYTQNWKNRIIDSNYCDFPETKGKETKLSKILEMDQLLERMSLSDLVMKEVDIDTFVEFKFNAKFLIYLKHLDQYATLQINFTHTQFLLNIHIFLES